MKSAKRTCIDHFGKRLARANVGVEFIDVGEDDWICAFPDWARPTEDAFFRAWMARPTTRRKTLDFDILLEIPTRYVSGTAWEVPTFARDVMNDVNEFVKCEGIVFKKCTIDWMGTSPHQTLPRISGGLVARVCWGKRRMGSFGTITFKNGEGDLVISTGSFEVSSGENSFIVMTFTQ